MNKYPAVVSWLSALLATATLSTLKAQTTPASSTAQGQEQTVEMPAYVVGTQGMGYVDANTVSGFKTGQALLDIPQSELVMTQDMLKDVSASYNNCYSDSLAYAGAATFARSGTISLMFRGSRAATNITDNLQGPNWFNNDLMDSYEIIKGPFLGYAGAGGPLGSVLGTTKKPLNHQATSITGEADSLGGFMGTLDSTGPIGAFGNFKLSYRVVASDRYQGYWFADSYYSERDLHVMLKIDYNQATVTMGLDYEKVYTPWNTNGIVQPDGDLYIGGAYKWADNYNSTSSQVHGFHRAFRFNWLQRISDSWSSQFATIAWYEQERGGNLVNTSENYQTDTVGGIFRLNDAPQYTFETSEDLVGNYDMGLVHSTTDIGSFYYRNAAYSEFWTSVADGPNTYTVPLGPNLGEEIGALHVPSSSEYGVPANPGSLATAYNFDYYGSEQIDVIPHRLSAIAGWSWSVSDTITDSNIEQYPNYTSVTHAPGVSNIFVPRYGLIAHVTSRLLKKSCFGHTYPI